MRILCLHGLGTNGGILKSQSASVMSMLPSHWEWIFVEAEIECDAFPGVEIWPGPYRNYFVMPSVKAMQEAEDWLFGIIDEEGPFDGVFGFSEGASVAYATMLRHQMTCPEEPPLFRFGIFANVLLSWSSDEDMGVDVTPLILRGLPIPVELSELNAALVAVSKEPDLDLSVKPSTDGIYAPLRRIFEEEITVPIVYKNYVTRRIHPEHDSVQLRVPTAHILGKADWAYESGKKLREMCDMNSALTWEHSKGHEIPRNGIDVLKIKEIIEKTVTRSEFGS